MTIRCPATDVIYPKPFLVLPKGDDPAITGQNSTMICNNYLFQSLTRTDIATHRYRRRSFLRRDTARVRKYPSSSDGKNHNFRRKMLLSLMKVYPYFLSGRLILNRSNRTTHKNSSCLMGMMSQLKIEQLTLERQIPPRNIKTVPSRAFHINGRNRESTLVNRFVYPDLFQDGYGIDNQQITAHFVSGKLLSIYK